MVHFQVLDSQQADRVHINPPAQGEGHVSQEGMGVGSAQHDPPAVLAPQPPAEAGSRANQVHAGAPAVYLAQSYFDLASFSTFLMIASISRMSTGRLGWVKLISGAGMRLCLMFGGMCL